MAVIMEKIEEAMKQNEEKKKGFMKSILMLLLEWQNFEKDFDISTTCLKQCFNELDAKEKNLNAVQESVVESTKELDSIRVSVEKRREQVEAKEEEFRVFCDKESRDLECKWEEFKVARKGFDDVVKLREEKLNEQEEMVERLWSETEYERKQLEDLGKSVESKCKEISVKEKEFEERSKEFNRIESWIREETDAILLKEREFKERLEEFEVKEKALQLMEKEISEETDALLLKESKFKERVEEFEVKEKVLQLMEKEMETKERRLDSVRKELMDKENCLDNVKEEVRVKEAALASVKNELSEKEHNLASIQRELKEKETTLVFVKTELCGKVNTLGSVKKQLSIKEDRLSLLKKEMETREMSLDSVREELMAKESCLNNVKEELRVKEAELDTVKKELGEKEYNMESIQKELGEKETILVSVTKELQGKVNDLDSLKKQLRIKEDHLSLLKKELEIKDKCADAINKKLEGREQQLLSLQEGFQLREERLQFWEGELNFVETEYRRRLKELDSREKKLAPVSFDGELKLEKENLQKEQGLLKKRMEEIALKEKQVEARFGELKQREKHIEDRLKVLEEQEKQLNTVCNVPVETEPTDNVRVDRVGGLGAITSVPADIRFSINDGKSLQIFLNEREKALDSMSDEVFKALQLSADPGQLVLEAMEGFYPPHLRKGDTEFEGNVTRQSCILLLEQLIRVSPKIQPTVLVSALDLAREWKAKLRATFKNQLEILGFLYLLAAYNLAPAFKEDELVRLLTIVVEQNKSKDLCRLLGVKEKISCFIQNLIANQKHVEAVKNAYAFDLVGHFPPIPILKDYVKQVMQISENACNRETWSAEEKNEAIDQSIASIRAVIRSILDHELQAQYPFAQLEECIESLTRQKVDATASSVISEAQKPQQTQLAEMTSACPSLPTDTKALRSTSSSEKASTCKLGHSDAFAAILVGMGGKNLQTLLNDHWAELELLRIEVSRALKISTDSGMLVLEALGGFYPPEPHKEENELNHSIIRKSCILLLEQLMRISPEITPTAKLEASKLASDWKAKMLAEMENDLAILSFLLLVGAYGLASAFDKNELENLCCTVAQHRSITQICHALGISVIKRPVSLSNDETLFNNDERRRKRRNLISGCTSSIVHRTSDPAKIVLDALRKCYSAQRERSSNVLTKKRKRGTFIVTPSVMKRFCDLLEQLSEVSAEIGPQVKIEATDFAVEWRAALTGSWETLGFLHFLATFGLSSSFDSDDLVGLVQHNKGAINLIKILGLADKAPSIIENLIRRRKWLLACTYTYEFGLVDLFSPVMLLRKYVLQETVIAKQMRNGRCSRKAQEKAITYELSALRAAVGRIVLHNLQSEYSPDKLRARISELERQMENLSIPNQHLGIAAKVQCNGRNRGSLGEPISQVQKAVTENHLASANKDVCIHKCLQKLRKRKRLDQLCLQKKVDPDANCGTAPLSSVQSSSQPTSKDAHSTVKPIQSNKVISESLEACPADGQISDVVPVNSGLESSQLLGDSHACDDARLETGQAVLPAQASCQPNDLKISNAAPVHKVQASSQLLGGSTLAHHQMALSVCSMHTSDQTGQAVLPAQASCQPTDAKISNPAPVHTVQASSQLLGGSTHAHHQVDLPVSSVQTSQQTGQAVLPAQPLCQPTDAKISNPAPVHTVQASSQLWGGSTHAHHQMAPPVCSMQTSHQTGQADLPAQASGQPADMKVANPAPVHTVQASSQFLGGSTHAHHQMAQPVCSMQTSHQTGQAVLPAQASYQPTSVSIINPVSVHTVQASPQVMGGSTHAHHQMARTVWSVQTSHQTGQPILPAKASYQPTDVNIINPALVHTVQTSSQVLGGSTHAHQMAPPVCSMQTSRQTCQTILPAQAPYQPTDVNIINPRPLHTVQASSQLLGGSTLAHHQMAPPPARDLHLQANRALREIPMSPYNPQTPSTTVSQMSNFREQYVSCAAVDGTQMRGAPLARPYESLGATNPHPGVSSGGCTSVIPNSSNFTQHYVSDPRVGVSNFRAPTVQVHPSQFMQHNRLDAPPGGMLRNYSGPNDHFMAASGAPRPFLPRVNPFYHQQAPPSPNVIHPNYFS